MVGLVLCDMLLVNVCWKRWCVLVSEQSTINLVEKMLVILLPYLIVV